LERGVAAAARLDAHMPSRGVGPEHEKLLSLNKRLTFLEGLVDHELDTLTWERLDVELLRRRAICAA